MLLMDANILRQAFSNPQIAAAAAQEARSISNQAREETRSGVERMNDRVQLGVAAAAGATVALRHADTED